MQKPLFAPEYGPLYAAFFFLLGTLWGSFFNVCVYRLPCGQSLVKPDSHCYHCGTPIRWFDNIPVFSYLILKGRCRHCQIPFSARYALIELLTGLLFLAVFWRYGFHWHMLAFLVFTSLLLVGSVTDIDNWIILDKNTLGGALVGLVLALIIGLLPADGSAGSSDYWVVAASGPLSGGTWYGPVVNALVGALSGALLLWVIGLIGTVVFRKPAMGFGDVKLMLLIGAFLGWQLCLLSIFVASLFGSVYGIAALVLERRSKGEEDETPLEQCRTILGDSQQNLSDTEQKTLLKLLASPAREGGVQRHHLPFGPHLALAGWLLMMTAPETLRALREYFALFDY